MHNHSRSDHSVKSEKIMSGSEILGDEGEEAGVEGGYAAEQSRQLNG